MTTAETKAAAEAALDKLKPSYGNLVMDCGVVIGYGKKHQVTHIKSTDLERSITNIRAYLAHLEGEIAKPEAEPEPLPLFAMEVCHEKAREALASHKAPEVSDKVVCGSHVSDKHPEPQKCGTCGGRGWEYSPLENKKVDCPHCDGTGKAGA